MAEDVFRGRLALVTGAASGIGREITLALAQRGARLIVTDIAREPLDAVVREVEAAGTEAFPHIVDVTDVDAMRALADQVHETHGALDILVNNAGVAVLGAFEDCDLDDLHWMRDINVGGVINGCRLFAPKMAASGRRSTVVNIASAAAFGGVPRLGVYAATKAAVLSLSECLHAEYAETPLHVAVICPGFVDTRIAEHARVGDAMKGRPKDRMQSWLARTGRHPDHVAKAVIRAIERRRFLETLFTEGWFSRLSRHLPYAITHRVRAQAFRRSDKQFHDRS